MNYLNDYLSILRWKELNEDKIKQLNKTKKTAVNKKFNNTYKKADNKSLFDGVEFDSEKLYDGSFFKGCPETKEDVLNLLSNKPVYRNQQLAKLGALCAKFKYFPHGIALNISCNSKSLLAIYKTAKTASKTIIQSQTVGLFKCVQSKYRFGSGKYNYSKQYVLNQHVRKIIEELCTEYGINPEDKYIKRATKIINITGKLTTNHIKKTYNLTLGKGRSVPGLTEEEALDLIYQQYPQIIEIGKVIDYDNEHYLDRPELQVRWKPNVEFDKRGYNTRRGFRGNSDFCGFKSKEKMLNMGCDEGDCWEYEQKMLTPAQKEFRENYVREYMYEHGITDYIHWDMTGSIYFIQYYKKHGDFIPDGVDPYAFMAGVEKFDSKDDRNTYKLKAAMQNNFDYSWKSVYAKYKNINGVFNAEILKLDKEHGNIIDSEDGECLKYSEYLFKHFHKELCNKMDNKDKNTEIFLDESCIYGIMAHYLRKMGYVVLQVYDSFWIGKPNTSFNYEQVNNTLIKLMKNIMVWYFEKYYSVKQSSNCKFICNSNILTNIITIISNITDTSLPNGRCLCPLVNHMGVTGDTALWWLHYCCRLTKTTPE